MKRQTDIGIQLVTDTDTQLVIPTSSRPQKDHLWTTDRVISQYKFENLLIFQTVPMSNVQIHLKHEYNMESPATVHKGCIHSLIKQYENT